MQPGKPRLPEIIPVGRGLAGELLVRNAVLLRFGASSVA